MNVRLLAGISLVALSTLFVAGYLLYTPVRAPIACPMDAMICPDGSAVLRAGTSCAFLPCPASSESFGGAVSFGRMRDAIAWSFTDEGIDPATDAPRTRVTFSINETTKDLGTYLGSCFSIAGTAWSLLPEESSGVICWFAGGGRELGLFYEDGDAVVKQGELDEGSEESPAFRGNFTEVFRLEGAVIPKEEVHVLTSTSTLDVGESALISGVRVTLDRIVSDSRCPTDVVCIWAGELTAHITLANDTTKENFDIVLGAAPHPFGIQHVALIAASPVVLEGVSKEQSYALTFRVE